jgi:hypothetical protein
MVLPKMMTFELRGNGGNYIGAEWIAAEGAITDTTADNLEAFLKSFGYIENPGSWTVRFDSPGGSLAGGIRLGELIRKLKLDTEVGGTQPDAYGHWKRVPGHCASAAAFAFLGGMRRDVSDGELGVHQFYDEISLKDPTAKVFTSLDVPQHQFISALLIDYVCRMGVDPRFVSIASSVPPMRMKFLDSQLLSQLNVRWHPKELAPWSIEPYGSGITAITRSKDMTHAAKFLYFADGMPRLIIENTCPNIDADWLKESLQQIKNVHAFDLTFPAEILKANLNSGILLLEFTLRNVDAMTIKDSKWSGVGVDGPRYMWGPFTYTIPKEKAEIAISLACRNAVNSYNG